MTRKTTYKGIEIEKRAGCKFWMAYDPETTRIRYFKTKKAARYYIDHMVVVEGKLRAAAER